MPKQYYDELSAGSPPENYEKFFVPAIGAPLAADLIKTAALRPGEGVLDVACGTGVVARLASRSVGNAGTVAGLDINPDMLAIARSATPAGMAIDWHEAGAEALPFPDSSFDAVLCQMGLQFVTDRHAALSEMRRVLTPGGRLVLNVPGPTPRLFVKMGEVLARHLGGEAVGFVNHVFSLHDTAEIQNLITGAGFREASVQTETKALPLPPPEKFFWQYVHSTPLAGAVARVNDECRAALELDVVEMWREFVDNRTLVLHVRMVVTTAWK